MNINNSERITFAKRIINGISLISVPIVISGIFLFIWKKYPEFWSNFVGTEKFLFSIVGAVVVSVLSIKIKILNRTKKAETAALFKEQNEFNQIKADREKEIDRMIQEIIEKEECRNWKLILSLKRSYSSELSKFLKILPFIHHAPLSEVVTISKNKRQIVWGSNLEEALTLVNSFASSTFDDDQLDLLKKQLADLIALLDEVKCYGGHVRIMAGIRSLCPVIYEMLEDSKKLVH